MEPIVVQRKRLINIIDLNRAKHIITHDKALVGWKRKQIESIKKASTKALKVARAGKQALLGVHMPKPVSYEDQYNRVLGMLRMDTSATIKLDANDYNRYVKDEWEWGNDFANSTAMYANVKVGMKRKRA